MKIIFFGAPGAGKGTMASRASHSFNLLHISTGDIFRSAMREGTSLGLKVKSIIESGSLVSDELTIALVEERLQQADAVSGWLLDGFPRTIAQAEALSKFCPEDYVINLEVSDKKVIERISGRQSCKKCGAIFHLTNMPPKKSGICDNCGTELFTRADDKIEAINVRLENYKNQTLPLIDYYTKRNTLINLNGEPNADAVWLELVSKLEAAHMLHHK